jgi:hypothetical protein
MKSCVNGLCASSSKEPSLESWALTVGLNTHCIRLNGAKPGPIESVVAWRNVNSRLSVLHPDTTRVFNFNGVPSKDGKGCCDVHLAPETQGGRAFRIKLEHASRLETTTLYDEGIV